MKHVYANGVTEWFVAESVEEAIAMCKAENDRNAQIDEDELDLEFHQEPDDKVLTMHYGGPDEFPAWARPKPESDHNSNGGMFDEPPNRNELKLTCREWADKSENGFLGTTEY